MKNNIIKKEEIKKICKSIPECTITKLHEKLKELGYCKIQFRKPNR